MTLNYQLTFDEFREAMSYSLYRSLKILKILFILMGLFFFLIAFLRFSGGQAFRLFFTEIVIGALFFSLYPVMTTIGVRSQWKQSPFISQNVQMKIDAVALEQSNAVFRLNAEWGGYFSCWETEKLFVLCLVPNMYQIIPKRAFANEEDLNQFRAWASQIGHEPAPNSPLPEIK